MGEGGHLILREAFCRTIETEGGQHGRGVREEIPLPLRDDVLRAPTGSSSPSFEVAAVPRGGAPGKAERNFKPTALGPSGGLGGRN